jgi:hypothetical protein
MAMYQVTGSFEFSIAVPLRKVVLKAQSAALPLSLGLEKGVSKDRMVHVTAHKTIL